MRNDGRSDKRTPVHRIRDASRWTLDEALAWIATRRTEAVAAAGKHRLAAWMEENPRASLFPSLLDAWNALSEAMADGLQALATRQVHATFRRGRSSVERNVPFPPADNLQLVAGYAPVDTAQGTVLCARDGASTYHETTYYDVTLRSADLTARFARHNNRQFQQGVDLQTEANGAGAGAFGPPPDERSAPAIQTAMRIGYTREQVIGAKAAALLLNISLSHFRRQYRFGCVPAPIKFTGRKLGWQVGVLLDWLDTHSKNNNV